MINKSFQLLRTNPLLTTNLKIVVSSDYNLYMESFNTNADLSNVKYKHYDINKTEYLENKIPYFYKKLPIDTAFDVRYDNDNQIIQNNFNKQFDTTYYAGAGYIEDQWHTEEFDYLAPLYIRKDSLPKGFVILRVDDPSGYNLNMNNNFELNSINADNFHEIVDNWKCVSFFDMTYTSNLGVWLYNNYVNNDRYPKTAFEYHPERAEFSNWYGMDYLTGIYTYKPLFMDDRDEIETPHFRWEKFITEGYKKSGLIFPYILNLKFLFDDTPATPSSLKKYSMNRYYGFYLENVDFVGSITSYRTPDMIPNTYLVNNIIVSGDTGMTSNQYCLLDYYDVPTVNPFVEKWDDSKEYYIFIDNTNDFYRTKTISGLYPIQRIMQNNKYIYKVISDDILDDYWVKYNPYYYSNSKTVDINYSTYNILSAITSDFFIDKYIDCDGNDKYMYGDLYMIKIDDKYHVIKYSSGMTVANDLTINKSTGDLDDYKYYIQTDYAINLNQKYVEYWILGKNSQYYRQIPIKVNGFNPLTFPIYRIKFSDIKDFDFDRINTGFSDFDYEKTEYVQTDEEKLYAFDYNDNSIPPRKRVGKYGTPDQYKINNLSSEYIADDELYEVFDMGQQNTFSSNNGDNKLYDLTDIWRKNQSNVKWGFMGSISHSDYPYKLNNNYEVGGPYNRTSDPFYTIPDVTSKNLDYFYRLGNFYNVTTGDTVYYKNQTTNIQYDFISGQIGNGFDINAYFTLNFDYFTFFFKNKMYYEEKDTLYTKSYDKYSVLNYGDSNIPSVTLFKGLKIKVKEVKNIYTDTNNNIVKVLYGNNTYNNYKLSIILNENYDGNNAGLINNSYVDTSQNGINIIMNEKFQNILIIINTKFPSGSTLNDLSKFNETDGLYYGKKLDGTILSDYDPSKYTTSNFINVINDYANGYGLSVKYYFIRESNGVMYNGSSLLSRGDGTGINFSGSTMINIPNWNYSFPPFMINIETPINISLNNNCYSTYPYYVNSVQDDYVATLLAFDETKSSKVSIYRFSGPYEPIFKDVNLFKGGFFCYNGFSGSTILTSGITTSNASLSSEYPTPITDISWSNLQNMCSTNSNSYVEVNCPPTTGVSSKYLAVRGFDFSSVPDDAIITGITVSITGKAFVSNTDIWTQLLEVKLAKNCYIISPLDTSDNRIPNPNYNWSINLDETILGSSTDTWINTNGSWTGIIKGSDISDPLFGCVIRMTMKNTGNTYTSIIIPQIKCVKMTVQYIWNKTIYTADKTVYFDNNYKFDTTLNDFGKIDELIYSKVNEDTNILKDSQDKYHIYPCVDEFGYEYSDRFIFKSSWDREFFTRTTGNLKSDSGIV